MRANPFESQLERLARTLTEQFGVKVVCQGDNAWTDGRQIVLPSLPEPIDENLERMMIGYLDHELAHVAFSDFQIAEEFAKKHPGFEGMLNVVEDALIERRAMQRWPGVRANLDTMFSQIRGRVVQLIAQRSPFDRFSTAVYLKLAHHNDMLGLELEVAGYMDILDQFPTVQETQQAAALAEQLLQRWVSRRPPQQRAKQSSSQDGNVSKTPGRAPTQPEGSSGASESGNNRQAGNDEAQPAKDDPNAAEKKEASGENTAGSDRHNQSTAGEQAQQTKDQQAGDGHAEAESNPGDDSVTASNRGGTGCAEDNQPDQANAPGSTPPRAGSGAGGLSVISQALEDAIAEAVAGMNNASEYRAFTKKYDRIDTVPAAKDTDVQNLLANGVDVVRRLRRGLANALRSAEKRWWRDDQVRGSLSPRTLYRLCMDRRLLDVFRVRSKVQGRSTAVSVVLDASGSMTSRKMDVARQAMRVLLEALSDLKIATEAITFTTGDRFSLAEACRITGQDHSQLHTRFGRFGNLEIGVVKQFNEPVKLALRRLPSVRGSGLTPLGEAMQVGASRLITRPENRKIMVVLTDGKAGCESGDGSACLHAQHIAGRITKAGIELVGVGILDESLREIVADTIVIHELQELPAQLCTLLGRTLQKGLSHVG